MAFATPLHCEILCYIGKCGWVAALCGPGWSDCRGQRGREVVYTWGDLDIEGCYATNLVILS